MLSEDVLAAATAYLRVLHTQPLCSPPAGLPANNYSNSRHYESLLPNVLDGRPAVTTQVLKCFLNVGGTWSHSLHHGIASGEANIIIIISTHL